MSETTPQNETDIRFDAQNIRRCQDYVRSLQKQLDKAVENNDRAKIRWFIYLLTKRSRAVKVLAVNRVTRVNEGRHTAGVDNVKIRKGKTKDVRAHNEAVRTELVDVDIRLKPLPIRRTP